MSFYPHKEEVGMELYPPRAVERTMKVQEISFASGVTMMTVPFSSVRLLVVRPVERCD